MARCKECMHYDVCSKEGRMVQVDEHTWDDYNQLDNVEVFCGEYMSADVVPRSEVDRAYERGFERGKKDNVCGFSAEEIAQKVEKIAIELEAMRMAANSYKMHYENARVEVAREIDDLRRYIILNEDIALKCKQENGEKNEEYWKGKLSAFKQIRAYIDAELTKKYTEGEK